MTLFRWVPRFTPLLAETARPCLHPVGDRWFLDETYVKVAGVWRYLYRAVDPHRQPIDVMVSKNRDIAAARKFFTRAIRDHGRPREVTTEGLLARRQRQPRHFMGNSVSCSSAANDIAQISNSCSIYALYRVGCRAWISSTRSPQ